MQSNEKENEFLKLSNYDVGDELILSFQLKDKEFEYPLTIVGNIKGAIITNVIKVNNSVVSFKDSDITFSVTYNRSHEKPIIWENCKLRTLKTKNEYYYEIITTQLGKELNRRGDFRVYLGFDADIQLEKHTLVVPTIVKNISSSGLALAFDSPIKNYENKIVSLSFDDKTLNYHFKLECQLIREEVKNRNSTVYIYGAKFLKNYPLINRYITERQTEDLRRLNGYKRESKPDFFKRATILIH